MKTTRTRKELEAAVGGLSKPSKMPCHGFSIPAQRCNVGSQLRKEQGSTCSNCYALKGRYVFPNVADALERRYQILKADPTSWVANMVELLNRFEKSGYFRWHDSGDLQGLWHLEAIVDVANGCPDIGFWLPTRELGIIREYVKLYDGFPPNLTVRVSSHWIGSGMNLPTWMVEAGVVLSTVGIEKTQPKEQLAHVHVCPSRHQNNTCGDCRACWKPHVYCVDYPLH